MDLMSVIAPYVTHPYAPWIISGLLFLWALCSGAMLLFGATKLETALKRAKMRVERTQDAVAFSDEYETFSKQMFADPVLRDRWSEYRDALIPPGRAGKPVFATARPAEWFDLGLMRGGAIKVNLGYHAAMPNLLVGAGLLFTFLGLSVALSSAGGIVGGEAGARNAALKGLLDTASFKFVTSLVGLLLSIFYAVVRKQILHRLEVTLDQFMMALEKRIPLLTLAALQQQSNVLLQLQTTYSETLATDLSLAMQQAFDQAFDKRLGDHIGPLREVLERLADRMSSSNEQAMQGMIDGFLQKLQGGASDRMSDVAASLEGLGSRLEGLQAGLGEAAVRMAQSTEAMATRMGEGAETALTRITDQMAGLAESLRTMADQTRGAGEDAGRALVDRIEAAAGGFENAARGVAETLARAASSLETRMGDQAEANASRLNAQVEAMVSELRSLAEASRQTGSEALNALAERVVGSAASFETAAASIAGTLGKAATDTGGAFGRGAEEAVQRIAAATEGMRSEMTGLIQEFKASANQAGEALRTGGSEGADVLKAVLGEAGQSVAGSLSEAATRIAQAGDEAGGAIRRGGEDAGQKLVDAGQGFGGRADGLMQQIARLAQASDGMILRITEFEKAAKEAAEPLRSASSDLKAAGQAAQAAGGPLVTAAQNMSRAIEQMSGVSQRIEGAQSATTQLAESLKGATDRFAGVDRQLSLVMKELESGLQSYAQEVAKCVRETDQGLAKAVTQLHQMVNDLQITIEDAGFSKPRAGFVTTER